jgi:DnaJ-class molecular chaperone
MKKQGWELTDEELIELQKHFESIEPIKEIICPECKGSGKVLDTLGMWCVFWMPKWVTCRRCGGKGNIE